MGLYPDEWLNLSVEPVRHQFKLPIRGDEGDGAVVLKPRETHTLVELDVLQLHRFTTCPCEGERERGREREREGEGERERERGGGREGEREKYSQQCQERVRCVQLWATEGVGGLLLPVLSKSTLSLRPSLSSGIPVSFTFIFTEPTISLCSTCPFLLTWTQPHRGQGGRLQHHACTTDTATQRPGRQVTPSYMH